MLDIMNLDCGYDKNILSNISFSGEKGDIICFLGPNGSGKSTLIKTIVGLLEAQKGQIMFKNENIKEWSWQKRAKKFAYIPQNFNSTFQYSGIEIVVMGRTAYLAWGLSPRVKDYRIAEMAMEKLNISHLKDKIYSNMSGGERQLVKIAQALAQGAEVLVMDEPTNNLDFGNQIYMLNSLKELAEKGLLVIMATHFPDQALAYGNKALLINKGQGKLLINPKENISEEDLKELYDLEIKIFDLNLNNGKRRTCIPL